MAAPTNIIARRGFIRCLFKAALERRSHVRSSSSLYQKSNKDASSKTEVGVTRDGSTILCWHPEPEFPYEHTKPIPRKVAELEEGESVLKVQYLMSEKLKYREDGPNNRELSNIFFTTKHQWLPKPEKKYRKVRTPKDRERL